MSLRDRKGRGNEKSREENRERGEWESIVCVATTESKWKGGSKMQHNSEGSNALYSTPSTRKNED